jgi:hypothetical protein
MSSGGSKSKFQKIMKRRFSIFLLLFYFLCSGSPSNAQTSGSHTVQVTVNILTYLDVTPASVDLSIDNNSNVTAGIDSMVVTNASSTLHWATNERSRRVTVATDGGTRLFKVTIVATNVQTVDPPSGGSAEAAQVTELSITPMTVLSHIAKSMGSCTLTYRGVALASKGEGTDIHHLVFTVQSE